MIRTTKELTATQLESIWAGATIDTWYPGGRWECIVIDLDGEVVGTFGDPASALHCCMDLGLDSTTISWADAERRKREAQYRREHGIPPRKLWETIEGIWYSPQ